MKKILITIALLLLSSTLISSTKLALKGGGKVNWTAETLSLTVSIAPPLDKKRGNSTLRIAKNRWKQQIYNALKTLPLTKTTTADSCLSPTGSHLLDSEIERSLTLSRTSYYSTGAIDLSAKLSLKTIISICGLSLSDKKPIKEGTIIIDFRQRKSFTPALLLSFTLKDDENKKTVNKTPRYISSKKAKELIKTDSIEKIKIKKQEKNGDIMLSPEDFTLLEQKDILIILP